MRTFGLLTACLAVVSAGNIAEELTAAGATTLVDLVVKAGLADTVSTGGPFTVFAPTNEAFNKLPASLLATLQSDIELLKKVLLYHVVSGEVYSKDITNDITVDSVEGSKLRANIYLKSPYYPGFVTVNGVRVTKADHKADNGVIHIVSDVIYPFPTGNIAEAVTADPRFSTLLAAVGAAGLAETLSGEGPFTVFAPTNEAFAKIPQDTLNGLLADKDALTKVLLRHVVPGTLYSKGIYWAEHKTAGGNEEDNVQTQVFKGGVTKVVSKTAGARVVDVDIPATNGVIHAIDTVI
ncbi:transforming growth factor-beta-induced protein ig-h3 [Eurytemora carolleeae]|uniref:transforming growth factor-beta-induced protein ig-h3 n=1 Tax=Eurytemora carolleeae TaxID=1294199 RepID=UPI000C78BB82|nr:transforming growth factor-beta-induced protein ig-h3 [Eurytemora carolleeae]|eukprot:XP_023346423.1 transforming growth factor-beta-induced protein ig-h3-like [Eurytemora affinis]